MLTLRHLGTILWMLENLDFHFLLYVDFLILDLQIMRSMAFTCLVPFLVVFFYLLSFHSSCSECLTADCIALLVQNNSALPTNARW